MAPVRRILLKLSGEALMGPDSFGYHADTMAGFVGQIAQPGELFLMEVADVQRDVELGAHFAG